MSKSTKQTVSANGERKFKFKVSRDTVKSNYQKVLQEFASRAEIKGFRKGKAPLNLVEKSLDRRRFLDHLLEHIVPTAYQLALAEHNYKPIIDPQINAVSLPDEGDWEFEATTAERPEIVLGDYEKIVKQALKEHAKVHKHDEKGEAKEDEASKRNHLLGVIFDALLKGINVDIAPILLEAETKAALSKLVSQLDSLKLTLADYLKSIKKTEKELVEEYRQTAANNLKLEFIISEIAKTRNFDVEETDPYRKYANERQLTIDFLSGL